MPTGADQQNRENPPNVGNISVYCRNKSSYDFFAVFTKGLQLPSDHFRAMNGCGPRAGFSRLET